ncbi:MAG TPA: UvrD-helicase domain-containing protein [Tepidisphaeraceae bacterium]|nr:UvrD-helicase domain-containing protein [Tepidisphaeraceae bacterium]
MIDPEHLLDDLTEAQRQAVTHVDGPLLIIAGAGSGKTRVITRRVAYLISQGIEPYSILAITFTNKAAGEMKQRISALCRQPLRDFGRLDQPWPIICTFHSLCLRILRHYAPVIGLPGNFSVYDSSDQTRVLKQALKLLEISTSNFAPSVVHGTISQAKNQLITADAFAQAASDFYTRRVARIYAKYQQLLMQNNALDFDDLLLRTTLAFREHPQILRELQDRFAYLLIDEYQDTNHAQYVLAHALALRHRNICVVGDPDQSIYRWRGADIQNILDFEKDYPDAKVVHLEQNYRSTRTILHIASELIAHNSQRKKKSLWTENEQGAKALLIVAQDEYDEAEAVATELKRLRNKGFSWNQMAVFYRINALSRVMEKALFNAQIPYQIARGVEFYARKEIKDVLAYLRVIANPGDEVSLERIINTPPRGIGETTVGQLQAWGLAQGLGLFAAMERVDQVPGLSARAVNSIRQFVKLIQEWQARRQPSVRALMEDVVRRSGLEAALKKAGGEEQQELYNVNELITAAAEYDAHNPQGSLDDYLAQVSLVSDVDHLNDSGGAVTLMTLHAAKGLEFPVVAMIGLEEGCLPHARARGNPTEMEEERRLCFVGITRAQKQLILTRAVYRTLRGLRERTVASPFLAEMPRDSLQVIDRAGSEHAGRRGQEFGRTGAEQTSLPDRFRRGQLVRHPTFGVGRIAEISDMGQQTRAVVEFNGAGRKTLILQYARLEPVG